MKPLIKIIIPVLLFSFIAACAAAEPQPVPATSIPENPPEPTESEAVMIPSKNLQSELPRITAESSSEDLQLLASGLNQFSFDLYRELGQSESANLFFSPYSISLALTMAYAGADGSTADEMAQVFHYPSVLNDLHGTMNALDQNLYIIPPYLEDVPDSFQLNIANAIWGQAGYPFLESYLDVIAQSYGAGLKTVDFKTAFEKARGEINQWVEEETENKIKDLLPPGSLDSLTRMVITNAIYFNAGWENEFSEHNTQMKDFYSSADAVTQVEMMQQENNYRYLKTDQLQMVELPYRNAQYSMVLVMPTDQELGEYQLDLDGQAFTEQMETMNSGKLNLSMPKFEFAFEFSVAEILRTLGMQAAFSPQEADFSMMSASTEEALFISDVIHKAFVGVDEQGTEAAAATAVIMKTTGAMIEEDPLPLVFDHPFLFLIRDRETGLILFMGNFIGE